MEGRKYCRGLSDYHYCGLLFRAFEIKPPWHRSPAPVLAAPAIALQLASPCWHRHLRTKRSRARARIHRARRRGRSPLAADLKLLALHHTAPRYRELSKRPRLVLLSGHMGKQGKAPWRQGKQDGYGGSSNWSYWKGSWAAGSPNRHQDPVSIPSYDQTQLKDNHPPASVMPGISSREDPELMKAIQKALTTTRKADQKIQKVLQSKAQKEAQWKQYGYEMKQAYDREHKKYQQDLTRLDADLEAAMQQGSEAAELVKQLATHGTAILPAPAPTASTPAGSSWEDLIAAGQGSPYGGRRWFLNKSTKGCPTRGCGRCDPEQVTRSLGLCRAIAYPKDGFSWSSIAARVRFCPARPCLPCTAASRFPVWLAASLPLHRSLP